MVGVPFESPFQSARSALKSILMRHQKKKTYGKIMENMKIFDPGHFIKGPLGRAAACFAKQREGPVRVTL